MVASITVGRFKPPVGAVGEVGEVGAGLTHGFLPSWWWVWLPGAGVTQGPVGRWVVGGNGGSAEGGASHRGPVAGSRHLWEPGGLVGRR